jgi:hypothetical protein
MTLPRPLLKVAAGPAARAGLRVGDLGRGPAADHHLSVVGRNRSRTAGNDGQARDQSARRFTRRQRGGPARRVSPADRVRVDPTHHSPTFGPSRPEFLSDSIPRRCGGHSDSAVPRSPRVATRRDVRRLHRRCRAAAAVACLLAHLECVSRGARNQTAHARDALGYRGSLLPVIVLGTYAEARKIRFIDLPFWLWVGAILPSFSSPSPHRKAILAELIGFGIHQRDLIAPFTEDSQAVPRRRLCRALPWRTSGWHRTTPGSESAPFHRAPHHYVVGSAQDPLPFDVRQRVRLQ